jgi:two-component system, NtrC family, response regulator AtoC
VKLICILRANPETAALLPAALLPGGPEIGILPPMILAKRVAVVDDDASMGLLVKDVLQSEGLSVEVFTSAAEALVRFKQSPPNVLITDLRMKDIDGLMLLKKMSEDFPSIVTVMMTAFGSIESAIQAMKLGAYHYIVKPFKNEDLVLVTQRALERAGLKQENFFLRSELKRGTELESMIGRSEKMLELFDLVKKISSASANVLIQGESGSGKELVARAIHNCGARGRGPFIPVNCSAIPADLLESELFGHAKGSFTGAFADKKGLFAEAHGGTLFLDEIGDLSLPMQAKILRVLQDKVVRPVGSNDLKPVDARVITATHKDLRTMVLEGRFREDLYYRLNVIPVTVPPLRERRDDIPLLANHFLNKYAVANQSSVKKISPDALASLLAHPWPGNVRELENIIERAVVLAKGEILNEADIMGIAIDKAQKDIDQMYADRPSLEKLEERYIKLILGESNNQKEKAAKVLGISRRTLYRKERTYGLVSADTPEPTDDIGSLSTKVDPPSV